MACYHPLKAFPYGFTEKGKINYKIAPKNAIGLDYSSGNFVYDGSMSKYITYEHIEVPCGKCVGCRLDYSRNWSIRCMLEMKKHKSNYFITLTYDDEHLPVSNKNTDIYGEMPSTLVVKDLQDFWKRLRKNSKQKIRYFACGEYGDTTFRSHYHAIVFGLDLNDLKFYKRTPQGNVLWNSEFLNKCWKKGNVIIGEATFESACYVARYVMKKLNGFDSAYYDYLGIHKEFITMSRKPGIGRDYYELTKDKNLFVDEHQFISTSTGSKSFKPFRYFKKLYEEEYPEAYKEYKAKNEFYAKALEELKRKATSKKWIEMLEDEEFIINNKSKRLRKEI